MSLLAVAINGSRSSSEHLGIPRSPQELAKAARASVEAGAQIVHLQRSTMELIDRDTLRARLESGEELKLVMALGEQAYRAAHIPGSLHFPDLESMQEALDPDDEIVVYCSGPTCVASAGAYWFLKSRGYRHVRRYAGGLEDWSTAGYPLEGEQVERLGG